MAVVYEQTYHPTGKWRAQAEANARLIAAAPELAAALRWAMGVVAEPIHASADGGPVSDYAREYEYARAVLANVEG